MIDVKETYELEFVIFEHFKVPPCGMLEQSDNFQRTGLGAFLPYQDTQPYHRCSLL